MYHSTLGLRVIKKKKTTPPPHQQQSAPASNTNCPSLWRTGRSSYTGYPQSLSMSRSVKRSNQHHPPTSWLDRTTRLRLIMHHHRHSLTPPNLRLSNPPHSTSAKPRPRLSVRHPDSSAGFDTADPAPACNTQPPHHVMTRQALETAPSANLLFLLYYSQA